MDIEHDVARQRFVTHTAGGAAVLSYQPLEDGVLDLYSVHVPTAARGQGVAAHLVEAAMAYARDQGYRIFPSCSYVAVWLRSHPEAADLNVTR